MQGLVGTVGCNIVFVSVVSCGVTVSRFCIAEVENGGAFVDDIRVVDKLGGTRKVLKAEVVPVTAVDVFALTCECVTLTNVIADGVEFNVPADCNVEIMSTDFEQ